jgi:hypothetical protein
LGLCDDCREYVECDQLQLDYTACVCIDHFSPQEMRLEGFGSERLAALVGGESGLTAKELMEEPRQELRDFADCQPLSDDATIVVCRISGESDMQ